MSRSKRPSLAETMQRAARPEPSPAPAPRIPATPAQASERAPDGEGRGFYAATRVGKKKLTTAITEEAHDQFRQLAIERKKKGEGLLIEAINDLFSKYGKPPIA